MRKAKPTFFQYIAAGFTITITLILFSIVAVAVARTFHVEWWL